MKIVSKQIKDLVKKRRVIFSNKARHQLDVDKFDSDDLINSILHGKVVKKEKDERREAQYKYTIIGPARSGVSIYSCGKIAKVLKKNYFIITFHETR